MGALKIVALALIVVGVLALAYGGFTYTRDTSSTKLGPVELTIRDNKWVSVPFWAGAGVILIGGVLLLVRAKA